MNSSKELTIIGGKAGALIAYDLIADSVDKVNFFECFFQVNELKTRGEVNFITELDKNMENYFVATGDNRLRQEITQKLIETTGRFPISLRHATANISKSASIGHGNLILPGAVIHTNAKIGNGCIINTNATIEHDNLIGDYSQISPGAVLCGYVTVGDFCFISANSTIIPHVSIANNTTVGAGTVVLEDITEEFCLFAGIPAKLKKRYHESKNI